MPDTELEPQVAAPDWEPWDRITDPDHQPPETAAAYSAFLLYRDLPPGIRTARKTIPAVYGPDMTEDHPRYPWKLQNVQRWSADHRWVERASLYDIHRATEREAHAHQARLDMYDRHASIGLVALNKVIQRLQSMDANSLTVADMVKLLDVGVKVERISRGAGDITSPREQSPDGGSTRIANGRNTGRPDDKLLDVVKILVEANVMPEGSLDAAAAYLAAGRVDAEAD
jgi:hypothetical protein